MGGIDCCSSLEVAFILSCIWLSIHLLNMEDTAEVHKMNIINVELQPEVTRDVQFNSHMSELSYSKTCVTYF